MSSAQVGSEAAAHLAAVLLASAAATWILARLAPRLGWTDAPRGAEAGRKRQLRPVPAVGGAAILLALVAAGARPWVPAGDELWGRWLPAPSWCFASLLLVFAAGTWDDRVALGPGRKACAQVLALAPLALGAGLEHGPTGALTLLVAGLVALNLLNTFDNADGALAGLCALGFAGPLSFASAACLGFLPFNLDAGRTRNRASGAPSAYLGDSGAFVLAFLVLLAPRSAGVLVLPALDLARLALVRWRSGSRPWIGDRRHLAHRLEARGLPRPVVAATLCLLAAPACVLVALTLGGGDPRMAILGMVLSTALFALALRLAPALPAAAPPCPSEGGSE
jgi:UDP-N-acetylmuramyl pentapeptide phosphotransferase/UDP-N-acetylglucosamine-1-phosphate transferase